MMLFNTRSAALSTLMLGSASALSTISPAIKKNPTKLLKSGGDESAFIRSFINAKECPPTLVDMTMPSDFPAGTYYRNGGGRFVAPDGTEVMHQFDADGIVNAMTFNEDGTVIFRNKFVQTDEFKADTIIGGFSARGVFGTKKSGGFLGNVFDMNVKNVANTNVLSCGDRLFALWEGGVPYELDPKTLETIGKRDDIEGSFAAHPRYDPIKNTWVSHGVGDPDPIAGFSPIFLHEMDGDTGNIISKPLSLTIPGAGLMHDFALTENYVILSWNKCSFDSTGGLKALLGVGALVEALALEEEGEHIMLCIPRSLFESGATDIDALTDQRIKRIEADFSFAFHFGNAYEDENGHLILDRIETDDRAFDFGLSMMRALNGRPLWEGIPWDSMEPYKLVRYDLDLEKEVVVERKELCTTGGIEFPSIPAAFSTKKHKFLFTISTHTPFGKTYGFPGSFCKVDSFNGEILASFITEPHEIAMEPCLIPKVGGKDEDDAYVMAFIVNGRDMTTDTILLDAKTMKEVARSTLPEFVPNGGLHGRYVEGATFDFAELN